MEEKIDKSLKDAYVKNSFFNVFGWAWVSVLSVVTVPIVIHNIGTEQYGILALVFLFLGYFAFLDLGMGEAVVKFVSEYHARKDREQINRIINAILLTYIIIGLVGVILIILFTKFYAVKLFQISPDFARVTQISFYIVAIGFFLNLVMAVFSKIPEAMQRFDITSKITIVMGTSINIGNIIVVLLGGELIALVIVNLCGTIFGVFLYYIYSKTLLKCLKINFIFTWKDLKKTFSFGLYTTFTRLASVISGSLFQIIIGIILGPVSVAIYNIPSKLISRLQMFAYKVSYVVFPVVSELKSLNDANRIYRVYEKVSKYVFYILSVFFISILSFNYSILRYWIGKDFADDGYIVLILLTVAYYFHSISMVPSLVVFGMGKPKYNAIFSMMSAILCIILLIPLSNIFEVKGSAIAFLVSSFLVPFFIIIVNKRILKISSLKYFKNVFLKGGIISILLLSFYILVLNNLIRDLLSFIFVFLFSLLISISIFYLNIDVQDRKAIISKLNILKAHKY